MSGNIICSAACHSGQLLPKRLLSSDFGNCVPWHAAARSILQDINLVSAACKVSVSGVHEALLDECYISFFF